MNYKPFWQTSIKSGRSKDPKTDLTGGIVDINLSRTNYNLAVTATVMDAYKTFLETLDNGADPTIDLLVKSLATSDTTELPAGSNENDSISSSDFQLVHYIMLLVLAFALAGTVVQIARGHWSKPAGILVGPIIIATAGRVTTNGFGVGAGIGLATLIL